MGKIALIVLITIILVAAMYFIGQQRKQSLDAQIALMAAETDASDACAKNWLCATQNLWSQADISWGSFWNIGGGEGIIKK